MKEYYFNKNFKSSQVIVFMCISNMKQMKRQMDKIQ